MKTLNLLIYARNEFSNDDLNDKFSSLLESFDKYNTVKINYDICFVGSEQILDNKNYDFIVSLGGDGTMMTASRFAAISNIPVIGINFGNLGFITPYKFQNVIENLRDIFENQNFDVEYRTLLELSDETVSSIPKIALNEVLFQRSTNKLAEFEIFVNGVYAYSSRCDGILIATPTGSTAYSLSAGGSVISPTSEVLEITPLMPQTLSNKSLIISEKSTVEIRPKNNNVRIILDGIELSCLNSKYIISAFKNKVKFIIPRNENNYFMALREKLHWQIEHGK